jgi:hypothetical protein
MMSAPAADSLRLALSALQTDGTASLTTPMAITLGPALGSLTQNSLGQALGSLGQAGSFSIGGLLGSFQIPDTWGGIDSVVDAAMAIPLLSLEETRLIETESATMPGILAAALGMAPAATLTEQQQQQQQREHHHQNALASWQRPHQLPGGGHFTTNVSAPGIVQLQNAASNTRQCQLMPVTFVLSDPCAQ